MRKKIIKRLDEIRKESYGFSEGSFRWRNRTFSGIPIQDLEYSNLGDDDLIKFFEMVIRQYYKQG